jgi:ssDNA-binding replication factor A large subunit
VHKSGTTGGIISPAQKETTEREVSVCVFFLSQNKTKQNKTKSSLSYYLFLSLD